MSIESDNIAKAVDHETISKRWEREFGHPLPDPEAAKVDDRCPVCGAKPK